MPIWDTKADAEYNLNVHRTKQKVIVFTCLNTILNRLTTKQKIDLDGDKQGRGDRHG